MRIFLDIGHPAHVHYFSNFVAEMTGRGHEFLISARDKEMAHHLLDALGLPYIDRGKGSDSVVGKILYMVRAEAMLLPHARRFQPDLFLSFGSFYAAHLSTLLRRPHITFDDTENARLGQLFYRPFTDTVLSPDTFGPTFGSKHLKFPGYMELCHLHPDRFVPDADKVRAAGIDPDRTYSVLRFVAWNANHDLGHGGVAVETKIRAAREFGEFGRVLISSEGPLPAELEDQRVSFPAEIVHHVLAFADLVYGESATMASEAAVLGTPAVYLDDVGRGYTTEQEREFGMVSNFTESPEDQDASLRRGRELLEAGKSALASKRAAMLKAKIDVTAFMIWFVENYPDSIAETGTTSFDRWKQTGP